jgi:hypothetical protein
MHKEDDVVVIASFGTIVDAYLAKGLLETNDIACFLKDENVVQLYQLFSSPFGGIKLCVLRKNEQRALEILQSNNLSNS